MSLRLRCREWERKGGRGKRYESVVSAFMRCSRRMRVIFRRSVLKGITNERWIPLVISGALGWSS